MEALQGGSIVTAMLALVITLTLGPIPGFGVERPLGSDDGGSGLSVFEPSAQRGARVAMLGGEAMIVWEDHREGARQRIWGAGMTRLDPLVVGPPQPLVTQPGSLAEPALAARDGGYVLCWTNRKDAVTSEVYAQAFTRSLAPVGNPTFLGDGMQPAAACQKDVCLVAWTGSPDGGISGRLLSASQPTPFTISLVGLSPAVTALATGWGVAYATSSQLKYFETNLTGSVVGQASTNITVTTPALTASDAGVFFAFVQGTQVGVAKLTSGNIGLIRLLPVVSTGSAHGPPSIVPHARGTHVFWTERGPSGDLEAAQDVVLDQTLNGNPSLVVVPLGVFESEPMAVDLDGGAAMVVHQTSSLPLRAYPDVAVRVPTAAGNAPVVISTSRFAELQPSAAWTATGPAVAWTLADSRDTLHSLVLGGFDGPSSSLRTGVVHYRGGGVEDPQLAWGPQGGLVVFREIQGTTAVAIRVMGFSAGRAATPAVLFAPPTLAPDESALSIAAGNGNEFLVAWTEDGEPLARAVYLGSSPQLSNDTVSLFPISVQAHDLSVAWNGRDYEVAWTVGVNPTLTVTAVTLADGGPLTNTTATAVQARVPQIAYNGTASLVVFSADVGADWGVYALPFVGGAPKGTPTLLASSSTSPVADPALPAPQRLSLVWDGAQFLVAYTQHELIRVAAIEMPGDAILSVTTAAQAISGIRPSLATNRDGGTVLTYQNFVGSALTSRVFARTLAVTGSDGGSADSGSADGGSADGGSADGGSADGGSADGGSADGGSADGGSADAGSPDAGAPDGGAADGGSGIKVLRFGTCACSAGDGSGVFGLLLALAWKRRRRERCAQSSLSGKKSPVT